MCDYSLEVYQSRPAAVGEKVILTRFATGSQGFAQPGVVDCATCIPADSKLLLEGIDETVQKEHGVGAVEEVVMTRFEDRAYAYKDGVRFANGAEVLLQRLNPGVAAVVMTYGAEAPEGDRPTEHAAPAMPAAAREPALV